MQVSEKKTYVALVLDSSSSMSAMKEQAIGLFNGQRDAILSDGDSAGVDGITLVVFGGDVRVLHDNVKPDKIDRLSDTVYRPNGMTPMRDGIGKAINLLEARDDGGDDTAFLVVVVTDGQENASQEWTAGALSAKVTELQNTGRWTFGLYGADNLDLSELTERGGLDTVFVGNITTYAPTAAGMATLDAANVGNTVSYLSSRVAGQTQSTNFADQTVTAPKEDKVGKTAVTW